MRKKLGSVVFGLFLIAVGIGYVGNALKLWSGFTIFFDGWWTLFIIVPCVCSIVSDGFHWGNVIGLSVGVLFLLSRVLTGFDYNLFSIIWPVCVILIGFSIVVGTKHKKTTKNPTPPVNGERVEYEALFSGRSVVMNGMVMPEKCKLDAKFGGIDMDLRGVILDRDCFVDADAVFGGIKIIAPDNYNVKLHGSAVFGGNSSDVAENRFPDAYTVYVEANSAFGGVSVE